MSNYSEMTDSDWLFVPSFSSLGRSLISVFTARRHLECSCDRAGRTERAARTAESSSKAKPSQPSSSSDKSPSSGYSSQDSNTEEQSQQGGATSDNTLLIDLSSPGREDTWGHINILDTDVQEVEAEEEVEDKIRDLSFTDIALRKSGVALLAQLPQHAAQLQIDSFVPVELTGPGGETVKGKNVSSTFFPS